MSTAERYLIHAAQLREKSEAERDELLAKQLDYFAECYTRLAAAEAMSLDNPEWMGGISNQRHTGGHTASNSFH